MSSLHGIKIDESSIVNRQEVERELEYLMKEASRLGFPESLAVRAYPKLERIRELSYRPVLLHGDFTPEHVFLDERAVSVTDFERLRLGNEAWDLARFISYFDMMLVQLNVSRFSHLLKSEFLQATGRAPEWDRDELVNGFSLMIMLSKWVDAMRKLESRRTPSSYVFLPFLAGKALRNIRCLCENRPV